ncbi:MAG: SIMPL domain-containing protein [Actinomycetota bacterium]|nr:SIMPL domain-containing protein [Actinomycetota bacterium]
MLNERAGAADTILARFDDAIEKIETSGVPISPQFKSPNGQERISGYIAVVHQSITVADFDRLGELVAQLADQDLAQVDGPWWALRPASPVHRRARVAAVTDAVQRARDYAKPSAPSWPISSNSRTPDCSPTPGVGPGPP